MNKTMTALQSGAVSVVLIAVKFIQPQEIGGELIAQTQTPFAINGLVMLITLIPALGWLVSVIPMKYYTFIGEERARAHREIMQQREKTQSAQPENKVNAESQLP